MDQELFGTSALRDLIPTMHLVKQNLVEENRSEKSHLILCLDQTNLLQQLYVHEIRPGLPGTAQLLRMMVVVQVEIRALRDTFGAAYGALRLVRDSLSRWLFREVFHSIKL